MTGAGDEQEGEPAPAEHGSANPPAEQRTWSERYESVPGPQSPFYSPPPSSRALRWLLAMYLLSLTVTTVVIAALVVQTDHVLGSIAAALGWALFAWWRGYQIRSILRELARRRHGGPDERPGSGPGPADADAEKVRRRRAAWARVRHDVFPLLSNPEAFKRPFDKRNDFTE